MKKAVALGYEKEKKAPEVLAKGFGAIADKIIEVAEECGIEIIIYIYFLLYV